MALDKWACYLAHEGRFNGWPLSGRVRGPAARFWLGSAELVGGGADVERWISGCFSERKVLALRWLRGEIQLAPGALERLERAMHSGGALDPSLRSGLGTVVQRLDIVLGPEWCGVRSAEATRLMRLRGRGDEARALIEVLWLSSAACALKLAKRFGDGLQ